MDFFVLSDQTASQRCVLEYAARHKPNALLSSFLDQAAIVLREEVSCLTKPERDQIPAFLSVADLVRLYYDTNPPPNDGHASGKTHQAKEVPSKKCHPAMESCLLTLGQLSYYFGYFGDHPSRLSDLSNVRVVGICTGIFASIAVASARSLTELLPLALQMVRISFRAGMLVMRKRNEVEPSPGSEKPGSEKGSIPCINESWSTIVAGLSEDEAQAGLQAFHDSRSIPLLNRAYVSATSAGSVTISGPPMTLNRIWSAADSGEQEASVFSGKSRVQIPVYGPYHASHLYTSADKSSVLKKDSGPVLRQFSPVAVVHSAFTGMPLKGKTAYEMVEQALDEVLRLQVRWGVLLQVVSTLKPSGTDTARVVSIGSTNISTSFLTALKSAGYSQTSVTDPQVWMSNPISQGSRTQDDKIAIVGMSGRFPNAASVEALWDLLEQGLDVHREIPPDRFDAAAHTDPSGKGKNKSHTPYGCFIDEPGLFDPRFFNMSPREAAQTDPMGRLALTTAYEALEMSGFVPNRTPSSRLDRIGTFYGQTSDDWREINAAEQIDTYFITGGVRAFAPGRINYFFKFSGPSYSIDTACSSSLAAVQIASTALWAGDCDTACVGGLNVLTNPDIFSGLSKGQFLSRTGGCKTYDDTADGYCRGDACASIILKRYRDAIADKDNILGCILAAGTNHSAEAISITHPHAGAQAFLYKSILGSAGVDAHDIEYVEMHGTGTQAGDGIEMESVTNVFAPPHRRRRKDQPLYLGAIKANIGHAEAASGTNSVIKVLKMFEKEAIPPNVGIKTALNKEFPADLADRNVHIPVRLTPFPKHKDGSRRLVFLNNFSAAGGNTALLLEEAPEKAKKEMQDPRGIHLVALSARSMSALRNNIQNLITWIEEHPDVDVSDIAYTSTARRIHHNYRVTATGVDCKRLAVMIKSEIQDTYKPINGAPKVIFTFTGQGSQYLGVGRELYSTLPIFQSTIHDLQQMATGMGLPNFTPMFEDNQAEFDKMTPVAVQLGLACLQVALAKVWKAWGVVPDGVIGHSLGEYAALQVAGVISASEMVYLVGKRAELLVSKCTEGSHGMLAVKAGVSEVNRLLGSEIDVEIACVNGPNETVLSGVVAEVKEAAAILDKQMVKTTLLRVPFAFHSSQVTCIIEDFVKASEGVTFCPPQIPVLSPFLGRVIEAKEGGVFGPDYLARHAREKVNFDAAVRAGVDGGLVDDKTVWVELGAHFVTGPMVKSTLMEKIGSKPNLDGFEILPSLRRGKPSWEVVTNTLASLYKSGVGVDFEEFHRPFSTSHQLVVLPTYAFDTKKYWLDYHNNWCLTKGEKLVAPIEAADFDVAAVPKPDAQTRPIYSTSCQYVTAEEVDPAAQTARVIFESNLADKRLRQITTGHIINGVPLCPSSLNADMAMTAAGYLWKLMKHKTKPDLEKDGDNANLAGSRGMNDIDVGLNVCNVEVHTPMIPDDDTLDNGRFLIEIEATADFVRGEVEVVFRSRTSPSAHGNLVLKEHGRGKVLYEDRARWLSEWKRMSHLIKSQVESVRQKGRQGKAHTLQRGLAYRLFASLCEYGNRFRGMSEVVVDADSGTEDGVSEPEAVARVQFQDCSADGTFFCSPYWIDSVCHLSGFVVNSGVVNDRAGVNSTANKAFISHGWGSIRIGKQLSRDREYTAYVRMQPEDKMMVGDVYVLDGNEVVAVTTGLKFQGIPRKALDVMLPKKKKPSPVPSKPSRPAAPIPKAIPVASTWPSAAVTQPPSVFAPSPLPSGPDSGPAGMSLISRAIDIIQTETDVPPSELIDAASFDSLGVDSLMGLTIAAKFREDLEIDVPSSVFMETGTVGGLKEWMTQQYPEPERRTNALQARFSVSKPSTRSSSEGYASDSTELTVPSPDPSIGNKGRGKAGRLETFLPTEFAVPTLAPTLSGSDPSMARQIIATEMGIDESELVPDLILSDIGMDSLMSLTVLSELRDKLEMDLPADFLLANPTMGEVEAALGFKAAPSAVEVSKPKAPSSKVKKQAYGSGGVPIAELENANAGYAAASVLLQGSPKSATKLFMIPDGSGSATSYTTLPALGSNIAVFGLNCPFLKAPEKWTTGIPGLAALYVAEMRRRQPSGPYFIGGWSAGGIIAYEMTLQLARAGEVVEKLFLIDSPCPISLEPLPARLHEFFDQIGFLGSGPGCAPDWLVPHFQASVRALAEYQPDVLADEPDVKMPEIVAMWATDGVCGAKSGLDASIVLTGEDPAPMKWLLNDRTEFGDNGWGALLGKNESRGTYKCKFVSKKIEGHHFEILKDDLAESVATVLRDGLTR